MIDGTTVGTDYDQIVATGGVYLYDATLSLTIGDDFQAASGDTFTLIDNVTAGAVSGTFHDSSRGRSSPSRARRSRSATSAATATTSP